MTRKVALALGIGASLILAAGAARADCATEVHALQQQLGVTPGSSSDMSATNSVTSTPSDSKIEPQTDQADVASGSSTTTGTSGSTTMDTDNTTGTETTASKDRPTARPSDSKIDPQTDQADMASGTSMSGEVPNATVGTGTTTETARSLSSDDRSAAISSLQQADAHAQAGDEAACMSELSIAKQHMGM